MGRALRVLGLVAVVVLLCAASFLAGLRAGPSPLPTYLASITTPDTRPAGSDAGLTTPRYGYRLSEGCLFTSVDDTGLYFDPQNRQRVCVVPPEATIEPGTEPTPGEGAQLPLNCAVAPDQSVYCSPGWPLDAFFLQRLYERGELPEQ